MAQAVEAIFARIRERGDATLSAEDVAALEGAVEGGTEAALLARRLLAVHFFRTGDYRRSAEHGRAVFAADPAPESAKNLLSALNRARLLDEALAHAEAAAAYLDPIERAQGLCTNRYHAGDIAAAVRHGREALALKDAQVPEVARPEPVTHRFDPTRPGRNVISFSLYGTARRYAEGALRNAIVARHLYPGWTPRFYVDDSVPEATVRRLLAEGAQVRKTPKLDAARYGLFWRMLVEDDPEVDLYLVRDCDSVVNIRERAAVEDWLASGRPYHVMRDHPIHCELMLAGMWGAHRGNLQPMGERILDHVRRHGGRLNDRTTDQQFLRETVWPLVRRDALVHDDWFGYGGAVPFRKEFALPWPAHVGRNEFAGLGD